MNVVTAIALFLGYTAAVGVGLFMGGDIALELHAPGFKASKWPPRIFRCMSFAVGIVCAHIAFT